MSRDFLTKQLELFMHSGCQYLSLQNSDKVSLTKETFFFAVVIY